MTTSIAMRNVGFALSMLCWPVLATTSPMQNPVDKPASVSTTVTSPSVDPGATLLWCCDEVFSFECTDGCDFFFGIECPEGFEQCSEGVSAEVSEAVADPDAVLLWCCDETVSFGCTDGCDFHFGTGCPDGYQQCSEDSPHSVNKAETSAGEAHLDDGDLFLGAADLLFSAANTQRASLAITTLLASTWWLLL